MEIDMIGFNSIGMSTASGEEKKREKKMVVGRSNNIFGVNIKNKKQLLYFTSNQRSQTQPLLDNEKKSTSLYFQVAFVVPQKRIALIPP